MSVNKTLVTGFIGQLRAMAEKVQEMPGYEEEDYNPYWETEGCLEGAIDQLHYVLKDLEEQDRPGGMVV